MRGMLTRLVGRRLLTVQSNPEWDERDVDEALCLIATIASDARYLVDEAERLRSTVDELIGRLVFQFGEPGLLVELEASIRYGERELSDCALGIAQKRTPWTQDDTKEAVAILQLSTEEVNESLSQGEEEASLAHLVAMVEVVLRWIRERGADTRLRILLRHFDRARIRRFEQLLREDSTDATWEVA